MIVSGHSHVMKYGRSTATYQRQLQKNNFVVLIGRSTTVGTDYLLRWFVSLHLHKFLWNSSTFKNILFMSSRISSFTINRICSTRSWILLSVTYHTTSCRYRTVQYVGASNIIDQASIFLMQRRLILLETTSISGDSYLLFYFCDFFMTFYLRKWCI